MEIIFSILIKIILGVIILAISVFALLQAVYWLNIDNKIMFLLHRMFNKITSRVPRDRRF